MYYKVFIIEVRYFYPSQPSYIARISIVLHRLHIFIKHRVSIVVRYPYLRQKIIDQPQQNVLNTVLSECDFDLPFFGRYQFDRLEPPNCVGVADCSPYFLTWVVKKYFWIWISVVSFFSSTIFNFFSFHINIVFKKELSAFIDRYSIDL